MSAAFQPVPVLIFLSLLLPWLNPFSGGPSPAVQPWLLSLLMGALYLGASPGDGALSRRWLAGLLAALAWAVLSAGPWSPDVLSLTSACVLVLGVAWATAGLPPAAMKAAVLAWLVAALASAVIGLCQYFGVSQSFAPWMNITPVGEAFANLRQRNQFASLTSIGLAALWWFAAKAPASRGLLAGGLIAAALLAAGNAASASRTGLLQLVFLAGAAALWGQWRVPSVRWLLLTALGAYLAAALALPWLAGLDPATHGIFARVASGVPECSSRMTLWSNVAHLIAQKPWLGWGWGELDYAHFAALYPGARFCDILDNAHNLPLHLAVELGVPLALLVVTGFGAWLLASKPWREPDPTRRLAWLVLGCILVHSLLEYPLWYGPFQIALGLCLGWLACRRDESSALAADASSFLIPGRLLLALVLLAASAYAFWDYHRISQIYMAPEQRSARWRDNTLEQLQASWLFRNQVRFAGLTTTPLTRDNAAATAALAQEMLHYSPEPRVIEVLIESLTLLGRDDEAVQYLARYRAAFPVDHAAWARGNRRPASDVR